ncbi:unnamed protein product [Caenorhabditis bovis]|uniref:Arrestin C-terminal-like domain-containing protein n=1 Tax=Caenorhabditis bovis TaxID=2654633 RepID=A0A8S1FCD5_9PELO|nr:unnamed protein product [Caenorhabditis bovis]
MINTPDSTSDEDNLTEFTIELSKSDAVYTWNEHVKGRLIIKIVEGSSIEISSLRILIHGYGKVNCKGKKDELLQENATYMKKFSQVANNNFIISTKEYSFPIEEVLPDQLPTSIYSPKGYNQYLIQCTMEYKTSNGNPSIVKAVRGITVIEPLDLNLVCRHFFEPKNEFEQRKFGWFACTGGHIRLQLTIERCAFVCGEAIAFIGKIENKSDRRIEKVALSLVRNTKFGANLDDDAECSTIDHQVIQEDLLAMYIEGGCVNKIDKKVHIPCTAPSTPTNQIFRQPPENQKFIPLRRRSQIGRLSLTSQRSRPSISSASSVQRILAVSYNYTVKVKTGGVDVIELTVPVVIGTIPMLEHVNPEEAKDVMEVPDYKLCRHDKPIALIDEKERSLCNKAQLQHVNKYPFYATLTTSSKQSKKLSVIAQAIKTGNKIMNTIRDVMDEDK